MSMLTLQHTLNLYAGGPGSGRHKEVGEEAYRNYLDHLTDRRQDGIKAKPDLLDFVDYVKTSYRAGWPEKDYEEIRKHAVSTFKQHHGNA